MFFILPFHAAEQRNKERLNDSAESPQGEDFPKRSLFTSSVGQPKASSEAASDRLHFLSPFMPHCRVLRCWFVFFGQTKKMNIFSWFTKLETSPMLNLFD